jgi:uncharacterized secreted protein with C-terminal beta-propeller domain
MRRTVFTVVAVLGVLAGCTTRAAGPVEPAPAQPANARPVPPYRLASFDSCAPLLRAFRVAAKRSVGPYGFNMGYAVAADGAAATTRAPAALDPAGAPRHSGTNVQEAGVDEPDVVKTDGRRIVVVSGNTLRVVDAASHRVTGTLALGPLGFGTQLLLAGDRALVFNGAAGYAIEDAAPAVGDGGGPVRGGPVRGGPVVRGPLRPVGYVTGTRFTLVDLSGPAPRSLGTLTFNGRYVAARLVGGTVRVVVGSSTEIAFPYPAGRRTDQRRIADNRERIDRTGIGAWLPTYTLTAGGRSTTGQVGCDAVSTPADFSGTGLLTVLTFDLAGALGTGDPVSVAADGQTGYATATSLYLASDQRYRYGFDSKKAGTELYQFDISGAGRPVFLASGSVPGHVLNNYAMSEYAGRLRVATTLDTSVGTNVGSPASSGVHVLARTGAALRVTGSVTGLGRTEQIYAVRYAGARAYVVTFRQTDPLYVVDLDDADHPRLAGELALTGFSSYLHPLDGDRLLGVGQQADAHGRPLGLQVSVFDVRDPAKPARTALYTLPGGYPLLDGDAHGFLYWPATGTVAIPYDRFDSASGRSTGGTLVLRVGPGGLTEVGTLRPGGDAAGGSLRSLVIGGTLWTLTYGQLVASDLGTLRIQARVRV